jgi:hypothetical protein
VDRCCRASFSPLIASCGGSKQSCCNKKSPQRICLAFRNIFSRGNWHTPELRPGRAACRVFSCVHVSNTRSGGFAVAIRIRSLLQRRSTSTRLDFYQTTKRSQQTKSFINEEVICEGCFKQRLRCRWLQSAWKPAQIAGLQAALHDDYLPTCEHSKESHAILPIQTAAGGFAISARLPCYYLLLP